MDRWHPSIWCAPIGHAKWYDDPRHTCPRIGEASSGLMMIISPPMVTSDRSHDRCACPCRIVAEASPVVSAVKAAHGGAGRVWVSAPCCAARGHGVPPPRGSGLSAPQRGSDDSPSGRHAGPQLGPGPSRPGWLTPLHSD
jgi:hypothetical protein